MSYDIFIGDAQLEVRADGKVEVGVPHVTMPDAPVFENDLMTGNGNSRHPGYLQWERWCRAVGLFDFFFDEDAGVMREHPGCFALTREHAATIRRALDDWRTRHPDARPGFNRFEPRAEGDVGEVGDHTDADVALARLVWLDYWVRYALDHCAYPSIENY